MKQDSATTTDRRLIEAGFPCHQVGAETQRERGASSALPPLYFLHVWWARRPLTPSRAALLASLLPEDADPQVFLRQLGIEKPVVEINGVSWTLVGTALARLEVTESGRRVLEVDDTVRRWLDKENARRARNLDLIQRLRDADPNLADHTVLHRWEQESQSIPTPFPETGTVLPVETVAADPAWFKDLMDIAVAHSIRVPNMYGYDRAYMRRPERTPSPRVVLDPTSGGGSIPFEASRLGHRVIANELNPVASTILHGTLRYPAQFGPELVGDIGRYGEKLLGTLNKGVESLFPRRHRIPPGQMQELKSQLAAYPDLVDDYVCEDTTTYLYCRQVRCPQCGGEVPLLNTCWLSKVSGDQWGVRLSARDGRVTFETYRAENGRGPNGEDPNQSTVARGVGTCLHCRQAVDAEEIKRQARGESPHSAWTDRLYCVVAVRFQPKLDKHGNVQRIKSGEREGEIKTQKVRFFRPSNQTDLDAVQAAETRLAERWDAWDAQGLIPTESIPLAHKTKEPIRVGMKRWCDLFTPRQLLGHVTLVEELNRLKPDILADLGPERGRAVVTYLQFAIDKGVDYNTRQTLWHAARGVIAHAFTRHDFSLKWTFGEMIFSGPNSGFAWGLSQILDAYSNIADLAIDGSDDVSVRCGTAAHMPDVADASVDLVCMDPPYYNNVQYAELSDYFYVWQKRTLADLYPDIFRRRLTNKSEEAVANPDRDGGARGAKARYEELMGEIFAECRRTLKPDGLFTLMFTHKSQDAWETLTRSLIENGWVITATMPVESESSVDIHHKEIAAAVSSIFITCRPRVAESAEPASWTGFGGAGVQPRIRQAVRDGLSEFAALRLNPVDEMVAGYGRALRVLSEQWPVLDGDEPVGPARAMAEASRVVAEHQIARITHDRLRPDDLAPEAAMALTLFGIAGHADIPYDQALMLSKSLGIRLEMKTGNYRGDERLIGINRAASGDRYPAPLVRKGSKLRLATASERDPRRLDRPQTEWDLLHGVLEAYREGDLPVARAYLDRHAANRSDTLVPLLEVTAANPPDESTQKTACALLFALRL